MRKKMVRQCIGAVLASMVLVTFPTSLAGAQIASVMKGSIQQNQTGTFMEQELADQGIDLQQLYSELQSLLESMHTEIQKREQSSLSLRDFSVGSLFSCRGLT